MKQSGKKPTHTDKNTAAQLNSQTNKGKSKRSTLKEGPDFTEADKAWIEKVVGHLIFGLVRECCYCRPVQVIE